jgi:Spy/CpxP family protein refolding chaperone
MGVNGRRTHTSHPSGSMLPGARRSTYEQGSSGAQLVEVEYSMKRLFLATMMICSTSALTALRADAQSPGGGPPMPGPGAPGGGPGGIRAVNDPAQFLLSQTGELKLNDAQVTRLAAIARRSAERRRALRAQMDSLRPQRARGERPDSATRARMRQQFDQMRPQMERLREQSQADRRDAIAVLTPDQQAQAWERIARSGRGGRASFRGGRGAGARHMRMRDGAGTRGGQRGGQSFGPRRMRAQDSRDGSTPARRPELED